MFNFLFTKTPLMFLVQSFWRDEAFSYLLAKRSLLDIVTLTVKDFSPPLYYFFLHFWINVFGKSEVALRSLSMVFYWATFYVVFLILTEVFKMKLKKAFLYLLFFLLNPLLVYFAFEVRMYSMLAFFGTLSFYALFKKNSRLYLLATIAGLYTHYFMVFVLIAQYFTRRYKQKTAILAFLPWMVFAFINRITSSSSFWIGEISIKKMLTFLGELYTGYEGGLNYFSKPIVWLSLAIIAVVIFAWWKNKSAKKTDKDIFSLLFAWGVLIPLAVLLISFIKSIFLPRYLIFSSVGLTLLLIFAFEKMPVYVKAAVIAFFVAFSFNYQRLQVQNRRKDNIRKTVAEISALMEKDDKLFVASELDYFTAQYYLDENRVYIFGKTYGEIPDFTGKVLIPESRVVTTLPVYPNKAYVLGRDGKYIIQALY